MFKTEFYRIISRKTTLAAISAAFALLVIYGLGNTLWGEGMIDNGHVYYQMDAIKRDREITASFTGPLTEETVRTIWNTYGEPVYETTIFKSPDGLSLAAKNGGCDNYCNRFVLHFFADVAYGENGETTFRLSEPLSESRYLQKEYYFGYIGSGISYYDWFVMAYIVVCLVVVIALCPSFSEDYSCRAADVILPTAKGRFPLWKARMAAAFCFTSMIYWSASAMIFLQQLSTYGSDFLKVSCGLTGTPVFWLYDQQTLGAAILTLHLTGYLALLLLAVLALAVSAGCRQSFRSLILSLLAYAGPFITLKLTLGVLPELPVALSPLGIVNTILHLLCYSSAFYYPGMFLSAPNVWKLILTALALAMGLLEAFFCARSYCRHQV